MGQVPQELGCPAQASHLLLVSWSQVSIHHLQIRLWNQPTRLKEACYLFLCGVKKVITCRFRTQVFDKCSIIYIQPYSKNLQQSHYHFWWSGTGMPPTSLQQPQLPWIFPFLGGAA